MRTHSRLADWLGEAPPAGIENLNDSDNEALAALLDAAGKRQSGELQQALEKALKHVPFVLRGTVRRVLFP